MHLVSASEGVASLLLLRRAGPDGEARAEHTHANTHAFHCLSGEDTPPVRTCTVYLHSQGMWWGVFSRFFGQQSVHTSLAAAQICKTSFALPGDAVRRGLSFFCVTQRTYVIGCSPNLIRALVCSLNAVILKTGGVLD